MRGLTRDGTDVASLGDMKVNPGRIVDQVSRTGCPVLLARRGRVVAVVQAVAEYEAAAEERTFMRAVVEGLLAVEEGCETDLADVKRRLALD
jgi:prevent-host-death family protein